MLKKAAITFQKQMRGLIARRIYRQLLEEKKQQEEEKRQREEDERYGICTCFNISGKQFILNRVFRTVDGSY